MKQTRKSRKETERLLRSSSAGAMLREMLSEDGKSNLSAQGIFSPEEILLPLKREAGIAAAAMTCMPSKKRQIPWKTLQRSAYAAAALLCLLFIFLPEYSAARDDREAAARLQNGQLDVELSQDADAELPSIDYYELLESFSSPEEAAAALQHPVMTLRSITACPSDILVTKNNRFHISLQTTYRLWNGKTVAATQHFYSSSAYRYSDALISIAEQPRLYTLPNDQILYYGIDDNGNAYALAAWGKTELVLKGEELRIRELYRLIKKIDFIAP